eukprot:8933773-Ditylum_brightwellii.AAC.1
MDLQEDEFETQMRNAFRRTYLWMKTVKIQLRFLAKPILQMTQPKPQEENRTLLLLKRSAK